MQDGEMKALPSFSSPVSFQRSKKLFKCGVPTCSCSLNCVLLWLLFHDALITHTNGQEMVGHNRATCLDLVSLISNQIYFGSLINREVLRVSVSSSSSSLSLYVMCSSAEEQLKPPHTLQQIAESPTHRLLLKQWIKEEELIFQRVSSKESQIEATRKEITQMHCFFFIFHSFFLVLLYTSSQQTPSATSSSCHRSWIPTVLSLVCSLAMIWAIRYKMDVESHTDRLLKREEEDGKLLLQCVQELKKKGIEFDLLKEVDALRRAKSLRVDAKAVKKWSSRDVVTLFFVAVACSVLGAIRIILCS